MRFGFFVFVVLSIAGSHSTWAKGSVQEVVGDLVYIKGLNGSVGMDGKLQVGDQGAVLQVIKKLRNVLVARVVEENGSPVKTGDQVQVSGGSLVGTPRRLAYVSRVATGPRIDGQLDEDVWLQAKPVEGFVQRDPRYWMPITERTVVKIIYDNACEKNA